MENQTHCSIHLFLAGFFLFAISIALQGQNPEQHFRDIFERETSQKRQQSQYGNFRHIKNLSFFPDTLPSWFFRPPQSSPERVYAMGISDPDLSPGEAFQQAYGRAMAMAVLYNTPRIEYFRDMFTSATREVSPQGYRNRFDTFFRISASESADSSQFWLIDQHLTRYNESIVLIGFTPEAKINDPEKASRISVTASVLFIEAYIGEVYEPQASFDLASELNFSGQKPQNSGFNYTRKGNRSSTISQHNGKSIHFPMFVYRYSNPSSAPFTRPLVSYHGLWGIFLPQLLEHLTLTTEQTRLNIRTLEEQSEPERQDMTREAAVLSARIRLHTIDFKTHQIVFETSLEKIW